MVRCARSLLRVLPAILTLAAAGCFDVHTVDPGPFVLDDFDDGDFYPADPNFQLWQCYVFNPDTSRSYSCDHDAGDDSHYSLVLRATVVDPVDGTQEHGGAGVGTFAIVPEDFRGLTELGFNVKLESGSPPISGAATLNVDIGCTTAAADDGSVPGDRYVVKSIAYGATWQTLTLPLDEFGPPPWLTTGIKGGTAACLRRADSIRFDVDAVLADGQTGTFTLHIDDVRLR